MTRPVMVVLLRNSDDQVIAIVEHKDATPQQHLITEVNTGILAVKSQYLSRLVTSAFL